MSTRFVYLRDLSTRRSTPKGRTTRGVPVAVIMTNVDRENGMVSYAIAAAHPKDHFNKSLGRKIAAGRLKANGAHIKIEPTANGHEINTAVMNDIYLVATDVSERVKEFANKWLTMARIPKDNLQTIPSPALEDAELPQGRHAIPPPPPLPHA